MTNTGEVFFIETSAQTESNQTQIQQQSFVNTVTITLQNGLSNDDSILYREIEDIETNIPELKGLIASTGAFSDISAKDDTLSIVFPAKLPEPQNPNPDRENTIMNIDVSLDVNSVVTKPDGLKIYYASIGFTPTYIGEFKVVEGVLEQTSNDKAVLKLLLEQE
jgi:hypothetical protein